MSMTLTVEVLVWSDGECVDVESLLLKASTHALISFCRCSLVPGPEAKEDGVSIMSPDIRPGKWFSRNKISIHEQRAFDIGIIFFIDIFTHIPDKSIHQKRVALRFGMPIPIN